MSNREVEFDPMYKTYFLFFAKQCAAVKTHLEYLNIFVDVTKTKRLTAPGKI